MKIVILDGYTINPGDLSWGGLEQLGEVAVHDRTPADQLIETIGDAQAVEYFCRCMAGKIVKVGSAAAVIDHCKPFGNNVLVYLRWIESGFSYTSGAAITPMGAGSDDVEIHGTVIYGKDFAGDVSLAGNGKNISMIVKPAGSSGTEDPINQRSTIAWKVKGYTATVLQDAYGVRIEHGVSA